MVRGSGVQGWVGVVEVLGWVGRGDGGPGGGGSQGVSG